MLPYSMLRPEQTLSTQSTVLGTVVRFSHPSGVTRTASSMRTPPTPSKRARTSESTYALPRTGASKCGEK